MLPDTALHQTLLVVYAVLWGAGTATFGRLAVFAINEFDRPEVQRRFWIGVLLGNVAPVLTLAALLTIVPNVEGFWGILSGGLLGIAPVVFPRLLHACTASNERLHRYYSRDEARQVLKKWDKLWFQRIDSAWDTNWQKLSGIPEAKANNCAAHLQAAVLVGATPLITLLLVLIIPPGYHDPAPLLV